jgi:hypothetical protein
MKQPRPRSLVLAGVLLSVALGGGAWAQAIEAAVPSSPASAPSPAASPASAPRPGAPAASAPRPGAPAPRAASAPSPATSRGGHVARQASVSVVFVLLALVTLILV